MVHSSTGSTFLDEHHDSQKALQHWRAAADIREKFGLVKQALPAKPQYRMATGTKFN